ncbi:metalloproteinase inhibitor 2-like [Dunckerocampus dactyliophorus]|uniref:metalloproteinase inhibitor 2-like n=1 Tax=Dunckerocampus dactyliophorus TaxID=161453 RepID=UPI0024071C71|nr:metalloproteinase inhibitor 2-like [Dunckerocampus dactyliophorus]
MMSCTVMNLVLPLVLLCTWRLQEGAQACSCLPVHPQTAFCQADVVIKAMVVSRKDVGGFDKPIMYHIKQAKTFKSPHSRVDAVYTAASSAACGVTLTKGVEYLITGRLASDRSLHITLCDFIAPWDTLSSSQKVDLVQRYKSGCNCQITPCHATPCRSSSPDECSWTDFLTNSGDMQLAKYFACLKTRHGPCAWFRGAPLPTKNYMGTKGR